jgi:RNA polymerase sigma factor (sigma-70 family)
MLKAYTRLSQLSEPTKFGSWLAAIVRRTAMDHLRKRFRRGTPVSFVEELISADESWTGPRSDAGPCEDEELEEAVSALGPALRDVVRLRLRDGLRLEQIAAQLGVPLGTVKRRLHDARRAMRRSAMTTFDQDNARAIVEAARTDLAALPGEVRRDILGVALGGDLVRGDFIPNNSCLLVFPLISNRATFSVFDTPAYQAVTEIFDRHCAPYRDCAEEPTVWVNFAFDEIHLPVSPERFHPPAVPQPQWHSLYLFDLIDHHEMLYGDDFVATLYRPDPRSFVLWAAARALEIVRSGTTTHPWGFGAAARLLALKLVRLLQLRFAPGDPTIHRQRVLENFATHVPDFPAKDLGRKLWKRDLAARYPVDRKKPTAPHVKQCAQFVEDACELLLARR